MNKFIFAIIILLFTSLNAFGQFEVVISDADIQSFGDSVDVDVRVNGFEDLQAMQFSLNWDPDVIRAGRIVSFNSMLEDFSPEGNIGLAPSSEAVNFGQLTCVWAEGTDTHDLPDGSVLFTIRMAVNGEQCDETTLVLSDTPRQTEVTAFNATGNFVQLDVSASGGNIRLDDGSTECGGGMNPNPNGVNYIIEDLNAGAGQQVCVPITVRNFDNIASLQFALRWNPDVLSYNEDNGVMAGGIDPVLNEQQVDNGLLRVLWSLESDGLPRSIDDGDNLIEVCFDVVGDIGETDTIEFASLPDALPPFDVFTNSINPDTDMTEEEDVFLDNGVFTVGSGGPGPVCDTGVGFTFERTYTENADTICVPIIVERFVDVVGAQFAIRFDQDVLNFIDVMDGPFFEDVNVEADEEAQALRLLWNEENADFVTVDDGSVFADLCFEVVGDINDSTLISIGSIQPFFNVEISGQTSDGGLGTVDFCTLDGTVVVGEEPASTDSVTFIASDEFFLDMGQEVCVDFTVENFTDISSAQFELNWDETVITFIEARNPGLPGLTIGASTFMETDENSIRFVYTNNDGGTVADGTVAFELCFESIPDCESGAVSPITFSDSEDFTFEVSNTDSDVLPSRGIDGRVRASCDDDSPRVEAQRIVSPSCPGDRNGAIDIEGFNLEGTLSCTWTDANGDEISQNCSVRGLVAGDYTVMVRDENGITAQNTITVEDPAPITIGSTEILDCPEEGLANGRIRYTFNGGVGDYRITMTNNGMVESDDITLGSVEPADSILLRVEDANNCEYSLSYILEACGGPAGTCDVSTPVITPNGDGQNDVFQIGCLNDSDFNTLTNRLEVYNRWGELVFDAEDYRNDWEGTDANGDVIDHGGYMWVLVIQDGADRQVYRGTLSVLR